MLFLARAPEEGRIQHLAELDQAYENSELLGLLNHVCTDKQDRLEGTSNSLQEGLAQ
jgi:hypothetical protein